MKRIGLALSGGGALGIAHIGVLRAFVDEGIPVDCIAGTSAGAIVAAGYAFEVPLETLTRKAGEINWYTMASLPDSKLGIASNRKIEEIMRSMVKDANLRDAAIPLAVVATDIEGGDEVVFREGVAAVAVRASACIPGLFVPVTIGGRKFVDGGLTEHLPLSPLRSMGAEARIGVNVMPWHARREVRNVIDVMVNFVSILASHQRHLVPLNADLLIEPDLAAYSVSDFGKADALIDEGYRATMAKMPEIRRLAGLAPHGKKENILRRFIRWLRS